MAMTLTSTHITDNTTQPDPSPHVTVLVDRCAGCQECVVRCPTGALSMEPSTWTATSDDASCVGCRQCVRTCPFGAIVVQGPVLVTARVTCPPHHPEQLTGSLAETRTGIHSWADAIAEANRCMTCPDPTCVRGCPAHNDIPSFIAAIRDGDLDEAHRVLRLTSLLPDICSRVCDQAVQCEGACTWSLAGDTPVAIGALERFITDNAPIQPLQHVSERGSDLDVAIVGSGPAGIGAAWELAQAGAAVTVFEKDDQPGGLPRWGIPDFTLPQTVSSRPWDALLSGGVTLHCSTEMKPDQLEHLVQSYDAVILAHGAGTPVRLPVDGAALEGVWNSTRFLVEARAALAEHRPLPVLAERANPGVVHAPTVLVLGAGNTAMDVARLARRLGAAVICVDWMDRRFAPVRPDELEEAAAEGVDIRFSTTIDHLEGVAGRVAVAHLNRTRQGSATDTPRVVGQSEAKEHVDLVVMAMGYRPDSEFAAILPGVPVPRTELGLPDRRWQASGLLAAAAPAFARRQPIGKQALGRESALARSALSVANRVWAAGDALVGPGTVVEAMAQGRRVAHAILDAQPSRATSQALKETAS
jgi:glutamate synthase (NADPH/NADH) small chain